MLIELIKKVDELGLLMNIELDDEGYLNCELKDENTGNVVYSMSSRNEMEMFRCLFNYVYDPKQYVEIAKAHAETVEV